ncbi:MAG: DUF4474 domain-containing protein [Candidatus Fimenecus sp.]
MKLRILRIIAGITAVVLMCTCLAACGKGNGDENTTGVTKPSSVEAPSDDDMVNLDDLTIDESSNVEDTSDEVTLPSVSPSGGSTSGGNTSGGNTTGGNTSGGNQSTSSTQLTTEDVIRTVKALGYEYDEEQGIFYSTLNPWQRHFGFGDAYDEAAVYANMRYTTIKVDFVYQGLLWRIQCWKGQYGVLAGGEMGVYTKDPNDTSSDFYECASDENLLEMQFKFYKTVGDFNRKAPAFERKLQEHWWLTGFQFGYCDPKVCVMEMTLNARDTAMANGIEKGLKAVTDKNGNLNAFKQYTGTNSTGSDFYIRNGNTFRIIWVKAGYQNYA